MSLKKYANGQKICMVEQAPVDESRLIQVLGDYYVLRSLDSAQKALSLFEKEFFHFVIIPSNMKSMNSTIFIKGMQSQFPKINMVVLIDEKRLSSIGHFIKFNIKNFILKPFNNLQIEQLCMDLSKKFIEDMVIYKKSEVLTKFILDSQPNMNFILSENKIIFANNAFYNFFDDITTLEEFTQKYKNIADLFEEDALHGYLGKFCNGKSWIQQIIQNPEESFKVKIVKDGTPHIFAININTDEVTKDTVVSLTNIDNIEKHTLQVENELSLVKSEDEKLKQIVDFKMSYMDELISNIEGQMKLPINTIKMIQRDLLTSYKQDELELQELYLGLKQTINMTSIISDTVTSFKSFHSFISSNCEQSDESTLKQMINNAILLLEYSLNSHDIVINKKIDENPILKKCNQKIQQALLVLISHSKDMIIQNNEERRRIDIKVQKDEVLTKINIKHYISNSNIETESDMSKYYALTFVKDIIENNIDEATFSIKRTTLVDTTDNKDVFIQYTITLINRSVGLIGDEVEI